ncbi:hypothetical protein ACWOAH_01070 [Vagococcus vulneris]|uniref:Uncharacterized protein n=1 Tax=Vagococcus vulneris TaxID=1977869 RepID=A0A430A283_9ENTE|nr:hypothetical protein [Vagococcus vulneris]RSU00522.1 hypothetical protein CBF37_00470 [Vagococcus vulneris]
MTKKETQKNYKPVLYVLLAVYLIELVWFFYSKIIVKLINHQPIDVASKELAIILGIVLLVILVIFMLKKSRKVGSVLIAVLIISVIGFCIFAPLFDVYIPVIWEIFHKFF